MASKKKGSKGKSDAADPLLKGLMEARRNIVDNAQGKISEGLRRGDCSALYNALPDDLRKKEERLEEEAEKELEEKIIAQKQKVLSNVGCSEDGDQSPLRGDEAQVLRNQWSMGMDCNPLNPDNSHLSGWLRCLWWGDYQAAMAFINKVKRAQVSKLLEARESLVNVSAVFHVIIGAKFLRGDTEQVKGARKVAKMLMNVEVKDEHEKILTKLIELGANIHAKDVAGYTPLHHCMSSTGNSITRSLARQLLQAGADPNVQNRFGCTPLSEPVNSTNLENIELLLEFGADPDIKEFTDGISCRRLGTHSKVTELFSKADKQKSKQARSSAKEEAGGCLWLCKVCQGDGDNKRCTGCYMVWYCGEKCQLGDWANHKEECKVIRKQYRQFVLVDEMTGVMCNITKKTHVKNFGKLPSKKHFVVKVQVPVYSNSDPMLIYNKDKSLCGKLHRQGQEEVFDMLVMSIKGEGGYKGLKGFFYAIHSGEVNKDGKMEAIVMKINPEKILPLETW